MFPFPVKGYCKDIKSQYTYKIIFFIYVLLYGILSNSLNKTIIIVMCIILIDNNNSFFFAQNPLMYQFLANPEILLSTSAS